MKNLLLTILATSAHILIYMVAYEYLEINQQSLFILFWSILTATWAAGILAESISNR
jgi:hypothetical protein